MYFGGLWGGQLEKYRNNIYDNNNELPGNSSPALGPKIAKMRDDMSGFAESPKDILIIDQNGESITQGDTDRRFFEASWMHKYKNQYYFSYSTGDTHKICYATGDNPYGPFVFQGTILTPVIGWTTHHSIVVSTWYLGRVVCARLASSSVFAVFMPNALNISAHTGDPWNVTAM